MKACLFLAFFLLQLLSFKPVSSSALDDLCGFLGDSYANSACLAVIGPDPRSKTVKDFRDVALIAADIAIDRAVEIQSYAKSLLESAADAKAKLRAEVGYRIFTDTVTDLQFVKESLVAKLYAGANSVASVTKYAQVSTEHVVDLAKFKGAFDDAAIVLAASVGHI